MPLEAGVEARVWLGMVVCSSGWSEWLGMVVCSYVAASLGVVDSVGVCEVKGTDNRVDDPAGRSGGRSGGHDTWSGG